MSKPQGYNVELIFDSWCWKTNKWVRCRCRFKSLIDMHTYIKKFKPEIDWGNSFHVVDFYHI